MNATVRFGRFRLSPDSALLDPSSACAGAGWEAGARPDPLPRDPLRLASTRAMMSAGGLEWAHTCCTSFSEPDFQPSPWCVHSRAIEEPYSAVAGAAFLAISIS